MKKRNRIKRRILAVVLSMSMLLFVGGAAYAEDGEKLSQTVYVLLDTSGTSREIIVRNGEIEQKNVKGELPFTIKISYIFDGIAAQPQDILGKSGDVKISIEINSNDKAKTYYKENLALQMQFPIDIKENAATDIIADGLSAVTIGTVKTLSGIVLPTKSAKYEISYKTTAFEQQSINFVCMPFDITGTVDIDIPSIESQVTKLQEGISQYVNGVSDASKGLSLANNGIKEISSNGAQLVEGYSQVTAGGA
ncbi:MAG: hypothetical protein RR177_06865, partial [Oscillospiraceae bacterium]